MTTMAHELRLARLALCVLAVVISLAAVSCSKPPFILTCVGPWTYGADVDASLERVAILITITDQSGDDLTVNPGDFEARDSNHNLYPANPSATESDAHAVRLAYA